MIDPTDPRLTAFVLGELSPEEAGDVQQAIETSPEVAQAVLEIRQTTAQLMDEFAEEDGLTLRATQKQALFRHAKTSGSTTPPVQLQTLALQHWAWLALAAAVCLLAAFVLRSTDRAMVARNELHQDSASQVLGEHPLTSELEEQRHWALDHVETRKGWEEDRLAAGDLGVEKAIESPVAEEGLEFERARQGLPALAGIQDRGVSELRDRETASAFEANLKRSAERDFGVSELNLAMESDGSQPVDEQGAFDGKVNVRMMDRTDVVVVQGDTRGVERVEAAIDDIEQAQANLELTTGGLDAVKEDLAERPPTSGPNTDPPIDGESGLRSDLFDIAVDEQGDAWLGSVEPGDKMDALLQLRDGSEAAEESERLSILRGITVEEVGDVEGRTTVSFAVNSEERRRLELAEELAPIRLQPQNPNVSLAGGEVTTEELTNRIKAKVRLDRAKKRQASWQRVRAVPNTSRLMIGDKQELEMKGMQVNVQVDGFRARVLVDCFYFNDRNQQLEGTFKLRLPDDASLFYFAFGESVHGLSPHGELTDEEFLKQRPAVQPVSLRVDEVQRTRQSTWRNVKEARMVTKEKAAFAYQQTVRRRVDPALVEWSGAGVFNARVFPLMPSKLHRIVVGYDVMLQPADDAWSYTLQLPDVVGEALVDLNVNHANDATVSNLEARSTYRTVSTRTGKHYRIGKPAPGDTIRLTVQQPGDVFLTSRNAERDGSFFASRVNLSLPSEQVDRGSKAIFLVDTSLSSRPDKFNVWVDLLRATLNNNRDSMTEFAVVFFNVESHTWENGFVENTAENVRRLTNACQQLALEGATDLHGALRSLAQAEWLGKSSKTDLFLLSDGASNWGETNLRLIEHAVTSNDQLGSVFAYQTGFAGTAIANLRSLSSATGGAVFSVAGEDEIEAASTAHRARPWRLVDMECDEVSDLLIAGRPRWLYPDQSLTIVGRLQSDTVLGPIQLQLERGEERLEVSIVPDAEMESELASRLYGQVAVEQLEGLGQDVVDVASAYARHFRITGRTCSLLMLESEEDYQRFNIRPREDRFVVQSKAADSIVRSVLQDQASELVDPKQQLMSWIERLENMPGMQFSIPTALKLAVDDLQLTAISRPLICEVRAADQLPKAYLQQLNAEQLNYDAIHKEAARRGEWSSDDAIKVLSSLVEQDPGNLILARDVAYSAMEMNAPAAAYHLLMRVAQARPYQPSIYTALGQCLVQLGDADRAILFYEIALGAQFQNVSGDYRKIVGTEYAYLLRQIVSERRDSKMKDYAKARLASLVEQAGVTEQAALLITMMWNTDQTDVDLHVVEPTGEECFYSHPATRSGGRLTQDVTNGFGPEMYTMRKAPAGEYEILVKYYRTDPNRAGMRSKVYLTIYRDFGTGQESMIRKTINVRHAGHKERVETLRLK